MDGEALEQAALRSCGCPVSISVQGRVWQDFEQAGLVGGNEVETKWYWMSLPTETVLFRHAIPTKPCHPASKIFNIKVASTYQDQIVPGKENSELLVARLFSIHCTIHFKYVIAYSFFLCWKGYIIFWGHIGAAIRLLSLPFIEEVGKYVWYRLETAE